MGDPHDGEPQGEIPIHIDDVSGGNGEALPPKTATRPPLVPTTERPLHSGRKRSRSNDASREPRVHIKEEAAVGGSSSETTGGASGGGARESAATLSSPVGAPLYSPMNTNNGSASASRTAERTATTPSRQQRSTNTNTSANTPTTPSASTSAPSTPMTREPVLYSGVMFSDSEWEREIAEFGRRLDDMLSRVSDKKLVATTAQYMRAYPQHSLRFQIKIKQRAVHESPRQSQAKLMLFYLFHEFLKLHQGDELRHVQREWFLTIDEVLHGCMRDMKNNLDDKKRIFKTLARWEELGVYLQKIKQWKALFVGEIKPRRGMVRLPRTEAERLAEAPDQLQQFPPPPVSQPHLQVNRTSYPFVFERADFRTAYDLKQHWRFTAVAFIDVLAQCLGISRDISLTAAMFFHRVFDRGIYAKERYKFAAACIFLSAKASSKRMKLLRMVKTMHEILETPLLAGDEEVLELERMQLLYYEIEVLKGVNFELSTDLPFFHLRGTLEQMPEKFRQDVEADAQTVLEELFWLPLCLSIRPSFLAEAAAYIGCRNKERIFSFSWCTEDKDGSVLTEKAAKEILKEYRLLTEWKKAQRRHFDLLVRTAAGSTAFDIQEAFKPQRGGLRIDVSSIQDESEYTQKGVNESRATLATWIDIDTETTSSSRNGNGRYRSDRDRGRDGGSSYAAHGYSSHNHATSTRSRRDDDSPRRAIKEEPRSHSRAGESDRNDRDDRDYRDEYHRREGDSGRDRGDDDDRRRDRDRDRDRGYERARDRDRAQEKDHGRSSGGGDDRSRHGGDVRIKDEPPRTSSSNNNSATRSSRDDTRTSDRNDKKNSDRVSSGSTTRDRSPYRRNGNSERDKKATSRDEDRDRNRDKGDRDRDNDRDRDRDRDRGYSRRSRSSSAGDGGGRGSSRSGAKRKQHSTSRHSRSRSRSRSRSKSESASRDRSSRVSRSGDDRDKEKDRDRDRDRGSKRDRDRSREYKRERGDRKRSASSSQERHARRDDKRTSSYYHKERSSYNSSDSTKIKEEKYNYKSQPSSSATSNAVRIKEEKRHS